MLKLYNVPTLSFSSLCRFVVGPYEESGYAENQEDLPSLVDPHELQSSGSAERTRIHPPGRKSRSLTYIIPTACWEIYRRLLRIIQGLSRHTTCPHPFSCIYYTFEVSSSHMKLKLSVLILTIPEVNVGCECLNGSPT